MSYRTATLAAIIASLALIAAILAMGEYANAALAYTPSATHTHTVPSVAVSVPARAHCAEDDPCWTWATMGNLERGLYVKRGQGARAIVLGAQRLPWGAYLVDASAFCRMEHRHMIAWSRSPRLKGDSIARRHGCDSRYFAQPA